MTTQRSRLELTRVGKDHWPKLEPKASNQLDDVDVQAKKAVAVQWCCDASDHAASYKGKPWRYALISHDVIAENMTLQGLPRQFVVRSESDT